MSSLNETPRSERVHIAFFGCRNAGKSSLINAITGQNVSLVSPVAGTTTDPVFKAMELPVLGPVELVDTAGWDDEGELGAMRIEATGRILRRTDVAVLVVDASCGMRAADLELLEKIRARSLPYIVVFNKVDLKGAPKSGEIGNGGEVVETSAKEGVGLTQLLSRLAEVVKLEERELLADIVTREMLVILVTPIDESAPRGRMILPQQQTLRALLDVGAQAAFARPEELGMLLSRLKDLPDLVITDSQCFARVAQIVPPQVKLTSFSMLFARYKGDLAAFVEGARAIWKLRDGDRVLIAEGCSHVRKDEDIGTVKIPALLRKKTGKRLEIVSCRGMDFPEDLGDFALVVHCGGCMLNRREMQYRLRRIAASGVAVTNYGVCLAELNGILPRCIKIFE